MGVLAALNNLKNACAQPQMLCLNGTNTSSRKNCARATHWRAIAQYCIKSVMTVE